ncbi:MAG: LPXTG cell wall anchor domain-containing protein [Lactobacillus sp.]|nr:LPXTG cell wall anchor domain-containing protein [Lactobacillus sp.]
MNRETLNKPAMQANEAKELPQTGENEASGLVSLGVLSIMAGSLGLFFRHKKDDEKTN